jgi:hypothetical protein
VIINNLFFATLKGLCHLREVPQPWPQPFQGCEDYQAVRNPGVAKRNPGLKLANAFSVSTLGEIRKR